jgi:hypothetical protein
MRRRWVWILGLAVVLALVGGWTIGELTTWPARRHLPAGAVVVEEKIQDELFLPDFTYELRARLSAEEFVEWMARLNVPPVGPAAGGRLEYAGGSETCGTRASFSEAAGCPRGARAAAAA